MALKAQHATTFDGKVPACLHGSLETPREGAEFIT